MPLLIMNVAPTSFLITKKNYQIILKYDGPIVFVLMELGRQIYSNSIFVFFQDYQRSCQNLSSWRAIFVADETPAHVAVREALVNLCIHTDYSENATMVVRLYSNKIVFTNPGTSVGF